MPPKKEEKVRKGLEKDSNLFAALGYVVNALVGILPWSILLYFVKKEDKFVRFHALQATVLWVVCAAVFLVFAIVITGVSFATLGLGAVLSVCILPLGLAVFIVDLYAAYKAYQGEMYKLPVIGNFAEKYV